MPRYDKSFDALFNPGLDGEQLNLCAGVDLAPEARHFSIANALWLAELCRFVYRLDSNFSDAGQLALQDQALLQATGLQLVAELSDESTSTRAVLFGTAESDRPVAGPVNFLVFCGTNEMLDWKMNIQALQEEFPGPARIHAGFGKCYASLSHQVGKLELGGSPLFLAGHSLGGALATLALADLQRREIAVNCCYSFGSPRVGDQKFASQVEPLPLYRVVNGCDIVTAFPQSFGTVEYMQPNRGVFLSGDGELLCSADDSTIQKRQLEYLPSLKKYADPALLFKRFRTIPDELPRYLSDHSIINYSYGLSDQLSI